jgi:hypothetical protein
MSPSRLEATLADIVGILEAEGIPYMLVGGLANAVWGEPRSTLDIDLTVSVADQRIAGVVTELGRRLRLLPADPESFVRRTRVLPVEHVSRVRADLIFALLPFEHHAIDRAVEVEIAGTPVRVCTPEDLILMKIVSERDRDLADARAIVLRRARSLDLPYLEPRIAELAQLLERPAIEQRFRAWLTAGLAAP